MTLWPREGSLAPWDLLARSGCAGTSPCVPEDVEGSSHPGGSSRGPERVRRGGMPFVVGGGVEAWPRGASRARRAPLAPSGGAGTSQRVSEDGEGASHPGGSSRERERVRRGGIPFVVGGGAQFGPRGSPWAPTALMAPGGRAGTPQRVADDAEGALHPAASSRRPERVRGGGIPIAVGDVAQFRPRGASRCPEATLALPGLQTSRGESSRWWRWPWYFSFGPPAVWGAVAAIASFIVFSVIENGGLKVFTEQMGE